MKNLEHSVIFFLLHSCGNTFTSTRWRSVCVINVSLLWLCPGHGSSLERWTEEDCAHLSSSHCRQEYRITRGVPIPVFLKQSTSISVWVLSTTEYLLSYNSCSSHRRHKLFTLASNQVLIHNMNVHAKKIKGFSSGYQSILKDYEYF